MNENEPRTLILDLVTEDDYGFWKLKWRAQEVLGEKDHRALLRVLIDQVRQMLNERLVTVVEESQDGEAHEISGVLAGTALLNLVNWEDPDGRPPGPTSARRRPDGMCVVL